MDNRSKRIRHLKRSPDWMRRSYRLRPHDAPSGANHESYCRWTTARYGDEDLYRDFERSLVMTKARQPLLLPRAVVNALERERDEADAKACGTRQQAPADDLPVAPVAQVESGADLHTVFDPAAVQRVAEEAEHADRSRRKQYEHWLEKMARNDGQRIVGTFPAQLDALCDKFPNFREATRVIESLAAVQRHCLSQRQSEGLLLVGPPGIGKTYYVEALAGMACVDLGPVSLGSAQGAFELTGTSQHWADPSPGKVWQLLAESDFANSILLLDEIDKTGGDERYRTSHALLDLLDPRTARRYTDQALNIEFDASLLWKVATANSLDTISGPVLSRLHVIAIEPPSEAQLRLLYLSQWRDLVAGLTRPPELSRAVVRQLVACRQPPRITQRLLRIGLGRALCDRQRRVTDLPAHQQEAPSRPIGFVRRPDSP